ncbi:winged helix-turn-helix transcriptional regulator [Sphingomonas sp. HF-S4]|uniref:Winged helix-turn-helix transcriptional regulator n=1 Tax=Sphingomonas agrestis TaxID=3080540 RepID=A0ABU3Y9R0_9SPHN|nr:winged helix-turn-helix transcriptional regulator [Sphingomonas sp. HF-S4]MDV3457882.1 winged helix-turn-helix transcriptional regulator [Sphingomonas sp. HF-S4]
MSTPVPIDVLRALGANRWALPVMALLSREGGARFAVIARAYGLSAHSLTRCLEHLRGCFWVIPNPRHGHPLRPEYLLSEMGRPVGALCERILGERERLGLGAGDLSRWSLPLVAGLVPEWSRFGEVQARLAPVTPRALSQTLQAMIGQDLVTRRLEDRFPVVPLYGLSGRGRDLAGVMAG